MAFINDMRKLLISRMAEQGVLDMEGKELPPFKIKQVDGNEFSSESLDGKPALLNFWFTSCPPCVEEIPMLNRLREEYSERANFIAITYQDSAAISWFLERKPFDFVQLVDADHYLEQLDVKSYPRTLVVDKNGVVRFVDIQKPKDLKAFEAELRKELEEVLGE